ncbi:hypothetical protein INN88_14065, partial [Staphylococcus aureus]|nr:hypothetical protein [Staphylococcus aureus]
SLSFTPVLLETIGIGTDRGDKAAFAALADMGEEKGSWVSLLSFIAATIPSPTTPPSKFRGDFLLSIADLGDFKASEKQRESGKVVKREESLRQGRFPLEKAKDKAKEHAENVKDKTKGAVETAREKAKEGTSRGKEAAHN